MQADENENLIPQTEEDISEILWVEKQDLNKYLSNTFPTIASVLQNA